MRYLIALLYTLTAVVWFTVAVLTHQLSPIVIVEAVIITIIAAYFWYRRL